MRIASLVPSATEMLFALGLGESVVGVTHECDFPPAARELPHLTATVLPEGLGAGEIDAAVKAIVGEGKALYSLDEEKLAELAPDLIVTQAVCDVCAVSFEDVARLGAAAGIEEFAHELRGELEGRLAAVRAAVAGAPVSRVVALEWLDPPFVGGHWIPEMIATAGGEDVAGPAGVKSPEVAWEKLATLRPELVVVMPCGWYLEDSLAQAREHQGRIDALGAARVFAVDAASTYSRPGPRLVDGTELLAHLFHPDLVPPPGGIAFAELPAQISRS
jgi:iron complex transport system substrate-binding protein